MPETGTSTGTYYYIPVPVPVHMRSTGSILGSYRYTAWRHAPYYQCRYGDLNSKYYRYRIAISVLVLNTYSVPVRLAICIAICIEGAGSYRELDSVSVQLYIYGIYCRVDTI